MDRIEKDFQMIFDIAMGNTDPVPPFAWVEPVFTAETLFSKAYADFSAAREHLCDRFHIEEDDEDLELFMNGLLKLEEDLARRMFLAGVRYEEMKKET